MPAHNDCQYGKLFAFCLFIGNVFSCRVQAFIFPHSYYNFYFLWFYAISPVFVFVYLVIYLLGLTWLDICVNLYLLFINNSGFADSNFCVKILRELVVLIQRIIIFNPCAYQVVGTDKSLKFSELDWNLHFANESCSVFDELGYIYIYIYSYLFIDIVPFLLIWC